MNGELKKLMKSIEAIKKIITRKEKEKESKVIPLRKEPKG